MSTSTEVPSYDALYGVLDVERPLDVDNPADLALYVEGLHKIEGINPADELRLQLERAREGGAWYFTGHRGVGKSTELRRVAHELRCDDHFVAVADMEDFLNLAEEVSIEALLLAMMLALSRAFERTFGGQPLHRGFPVRLKEFLARTNVDVQKINLGAVTLALKDDPTLREKIVEAMSGSLGEFIAEVREYVAEVLSHVGKHRPGKKAVLILDSLEKLRVTGVDAATRYDAIQRTFEVHANHLKFDGLSVVYSIPPYLPYLAPNIGAYFGVSVCSLPHVKVFERPLSGAPGPDRDRVHQPGVDFMLESLYRRYPASGQVIERALLVRLATASSGSLRDFYRLVKDVCTKAPLAAEPLPMRNAKWIEAAENALRSEMPMAAEDISWLKVVRKTLGTGLDKVDNLPKLARLFDSGLILSYRNLQDWCDVHYLLREQVDAAPD